LLRSQNQQPVGPAPPTSAIQAEDLTLSAVREFYFEDGELRMRATFDTTPEEKRGGFAG